MKLALRDLDTGLVFADGDWAVDVRFASFFADESEIDKLVVERNIKNAEMVFVKGDPPQIFGGVPVRISGSLPVR